MALFLSTYTNKLDRKGRVSVPAPFRAALAGEPFQGVVLFRSSGHACLEGFPYSAMQDLSSRLDHFDLFSAAHDDMATAIFGAAVQLPLDGDGRIVLPPDLAAFAGMSDHAAFVGLGRKFQVWDPAAFERRQTDARRNVHDRGLTLPRDGGGA